MMHLIWYFKTFTLQLTVNIVDILVIISLAAAVVEENFMCFLMTAITPRVCWMFIGILMLTLLSSKILIMRQMKTMMTMLLRKK